MGAAGLLRAVELLEEADALRQRGRTVGANVLVRSAFEFWLTGTYALFGGLEAIIGIDAERHRHETILAKSNSLPAEVHEFLEMQAAVLDEAREALLGGEAPAAFKFDQVARRLNTLILEATTEGADVLAIYNMVYRSHSTNDAHPPKTMATMIHCAGDVLTVRPIPSWNEPAVASGNMAMYVAILGRWIEEQLGGDPEPWDEVVRELMGLMQQSDIDSTD